MNTNNAGQIVISIFNIEIECFPKLTAINYMIFFVCFFVFRTKLHKESGFCVDAVQIHVCFLP